MGDCVDDSMDELSSQESSQEETDTQDGISELSEEEFEGVEEAKAEATKLFEKFKEHAMNIHLVENMGFILDVEKGVDNVMVKLGVLTDHLPTSSAMAWGIERDMAIELVVDWTVLGAKVVSVGPDTMRICCQVHKILENFLNGKGNIEQWAVEYSEHAFSENALVRIISYIWSRLQNLHMHCIICDEPHADGISMINPTVCRSALCAFGWQLYAKYLTNFQVLGGVRGGQNMLLRLFFVMAALSDRSKVVLSPWPTVYGEDRSVLVDASKDPEELRMIADSMEEDETKCDGCMKGMCAKCAVESWILTSNRSTILMLAEHQRNPYWSSDYQYLLLSNPPEMEEKFQDLKKLHGSRFYYHGSPTDNWHSILRNGFFVASGTDMQLHGAAHGKGVYVSDNLDTAAGYSRIIARRPGGDRDIPECFQMSFIAVCEVIDDEEVVKDHGWCKTIPQSEYIVPRFILGWKGAAPKQGGGVSSIDPRVHEWCVQTMSTLF